MARKTKEEAERTRQLLLECALRVFLEKGYSKTTLQDIASAADLTRGAVYWHFRNKKDLYLALMDTVFEPVHAFWENSRQSGAPADEVIASLLEDWLVQLASNARLVQALELHFMKTEQGIELGDCADQRREENRTHLAVVEELFRRGQAEKRFREDVSPRTAAVNFWCVLLGYGLGRLDMADIFDWKQSIPLLVDMYMRSIRA